MHDLGIDVAVEEGCDAICRVVMLVDRCVRSGLVICHRDIRFTGTLSLRVGGGVIGVRAIGGFLDRTATDNR